MLRVDLHTQAVPWCMCADLSSGLRTAIDLHCPELASANGYAMWDRKMRWDAGHHIAASVRYASPDEYRSQAVTALVADDTVFVRECCAP